MRGLWLLAALMAAVLGTAAPPTVQQVFPSGDRLPVNALRLSVEFAEAQESAVLPRLRLRDQNGNTHSHAFLEQELWSPDRKTLTVLFDPGRVKTGTTRHVNMGAPLAGYTRVELMLDDVVVKGWQVDGTSCKPLSMASWQIEVPHGNGRAALRIRFPEAIDKQAEHLLAVVDARGARVKGSEQLVSFEKLWVFTPDVAWARGEYHVVHHPDFENSCGDRVGDTFEHVVSSQVKAPDQLCFLIQ